MIDPTHIDTSHDTIVPDLPHILASYAAEAKFNAENNKEDDQ